MKKMLLVLLCLPLSVFAVEFSLGLGTEFPMGWSLDGKASVPEYNIYSSVRYGKFIGSYTDSMNDISESQGFYNSATGEIVAETLKDATRLELAIGYQQAPRSGWLTEFSYSQISGQGQVTGAVIAAAVADITLPAGSNIYDIEQKLESVIFRLGYQWELRPQLVLSLTGGLMKPINSSSNLDRETTGPIQEALLNAANRELEEYLSDTLQNDVIVPLVGVTCSYVF